MKLTANEIKICEALDIPIRDYWDSYYIFYNDVCHHIVINNKSGPAVEAFARGLRYVYNGGYRLEEYDRLITIKEP